MGMLENKVALVTGCQGICRAVILLFAKEGADVAFTYLPTAKEDVTTAEENLEKIRSMGRKAISVGVDVRKTEDVRSMVEKTLNKFGRIDVLVNCAGVYSYVSALDTTEELYYHDTDTDLKGTLFCCTEVAKAAMIPERKGRIVNVASIVGYTPQLRCCAYSAAKAAVLNLTRYLACEWGPYGIAVNSVSPGLTDTKHIRAAIEKGEMADKWWRRDCPAGRLVKPEEVAEAILWLASDRSQMCSGADILVDGGYLAGHDPYK